MKVTEARYRKELQTLAEMQAQAMHAMQLAIEAMNKALNVLQTAVNEHGQQQHIKLLPMQPFAQPQPFSSPNTPYITYTDLPNAAPPPPSVPYMPKYSMGKTGIISSGIYNNAVPINGVNGDDGNWDAKAQLQQMAKTLSNYSNSIGSSNENG